jgi:hypothetical protein
MHKINNPVVTTSTDYDKVFSLEDTISAANYDDTQEIIKGLLK